MNASSLSAKADIKLAHIDIHQLPAIADVEAILLSNPVPGKSESSLDLYC